VYGITYGGQNQFRNSNHQPQTTVSSLVAVVSTKEFLMFKVDGATFGSHPVWIGLWIQSKYYSLVDVLRIWFTLFIFGTGNVNTAC